MSRILFTLLGDGSISSLDRLADVATDRSLPTEAREAIARAIVGTDLAVQRVGDYLKLWGV